MIWLNKQLHEGYELIGDTDEHVVRLLVKHPGGEKLIRIKHMTQTDIDNADLDDIRQHFSRLIHNIQSRTPEQLQLLCT